MCVTISKQLMYWLIASSKGGLNRAKIITALKEKPMNMHQLAEKMGVHYTTIQHHVELLVKHGFVVGTGGEYGKAYFLSQDLEDAYHEFKKIANQE